MTGTLINLDYKLTFKYILDFKLYIIYDIKIYKYSYFTIVICFAFTSKFLGKIFNDI